MNSIKRSIMHVILI